MAPGVDCRGPPAFGTPSMAMSTLTCALIHRPALPTIALQHNEVGGAERGNRDVRRSCVAGQRINHRNRVAREIPEQLLARRVVWRIIADRSAPLPVEIATPALACRPVAPRDTPATTEPASRCAA